MKKLFVLILLTLVFTFSSHVLAQPMMGSTSDDHTAQEEAEGEEVWGRLQVKEVECQELNDNNYSALGEYFMGQTIGDTQRHAAMNQMMITMMGEEGEEQMHIVMGKRLSGCDTLVKGGVNTMMGYGDMMGWGGFGLIASLFWVVILVDLILLGVFLWKKITKEKK